MNGLLFFDFMALVAYVYVYLLIHLTLSEQDFRDEMTTFHTFHSIVNPTKLELLSYPSKLTQQENSEVLLNCTADGGSPVPKVTLTHGGVILATGTSHVGVKIKLTKQDHQVAFICKATSPGIVGEMTSRKILYNVTCNNFVLNRAFLVINFEFHHSKLCKAKA